MTTSDPDPNAEPPSAPSSFLTPELSDRLQQLATAATHRGG